MVRSQDYVWDKPDLVGREHVLVDPERALVKAILGIPNFKLCVDIKIIPRVSSRCIDQL